MVDHTIKANFSVKSGSTTVSNRDQRIIERMTQALCSGDASNFNVIRAEHFATQVYIAVKAMLQAEKEL
jgi:hypothetical protein